MGYAPVRERNKKIFCRVFVNPDQDYEKALNKFYSKGQRPDWTESYITPYASPHPIEDWPRRGHYLHIDDGLETAKAFNLSNPIQVRQACAIAQNLARLDDKTQRNESQHGA